MKLRIGIDFHVVDGKYQGSRTHVLELFARAIESAPQFDFYLFLDRPYDLPVMEGAFTRPNVHVVRMKSAGAVRRNYWQLPKLCRHYAIDIVHTQYILPWPAPSARVVTIHDVLFETHPQFFTSLFVLRSRALMRAAARKADHVFTVSEFCRKEIVRLYGVAGDRISVIHNGVDLDRFSPGSSGIETIRARGLASRNYILSVGRLEPRKNHVALIEAYAALGDGAPPLVLVGQRDFHFAAVFEAIERHRLAPRISVLEDVNDAELTSLYRHAKLFVYPAHAEGFGMPPLEAMASGTPVVTSATTAIPEVVGDAGLLVAPDDVAAITRAMRTLLDNEVTWARYAAAGRERALGFAWKNAADHLIRQYERIGLQICTEERRRIA